MGIVKSILKNHYGLKISRNWDKTYWAFDIHGTILKPNYTYGNTRWILSISFRDFTND
jgi:hypothetical protein